MSAATWTPMTLAPLIFYDLEDGSKYDFDMTGLGEGYVQPVNKVVNKGSTGATNDLVQASGSLRLIVDQDNLNHNSSLRNRGNGFHDSGYKPTSGAFSFGFYCKTPNVASDRGVIGTNDNANHKMAVFWMGGSTSKLRFRIGATDIDTVATYPMETVLAILVVGTGTTVSVWVNGVQVITNTAYTFTGTSTTNLLFHGSGSGAGNTAGSFWNGGYLGSFFLVNRALNAEEITKTNTWLNSKSSAYVTYLVVPIGGNSLAAGFNGPNAADGTGVAADYTDPTKEQPNMRIRQLRRVSNANLTIPATMPLQNKSALTGAVGIGFQYAKRILEQVTDPNVCVLLVPCAQSGSGISGVASLAEWKYPTGVQYLELIARTKVALTKGVSAQPYGLLFEIGSNDKGKFTNSQYKGHIDAMFNGFRDGIPGANNMKITISGMVPAQVDGTIQPAVEDTPNRLPNVSFISAIGLVTESDNLHPNVPNNRILDNRHYNGLPVLPAAYAAPVNFRWAARPFNVYKFGSVYSTDFNPNALCPSGTTRWVATNGSDAANGSEATPYATMTRALADSPARVMVKQGMYTDANSLPANWNPSHDVAIISADGPGKAILTRAKSGLTWTQQASPNQDVYATTISTVANVIDRTTVDPDGGLLKDGSTPVWGVLPLDTSIVNVQARPAGGYYHTAGTLYIKTANGRAPDANIIVLTGDTTMSVTTNIDLYLEGLEIWGNYPVRMVNGNAGNDARFIGKSVATRYARLGAGFNIDGIDYSYCVSCETSDIIQTDGFGYSNARGTAPFVKALEERCKSRRIALSGTTNNGSSSHNNTSIVRVNCDHQKSWGPVVADVLGAHSWNLKVTSGNSLVATNVQARNAFQAGGPVSNIDGTDTMCWYEDCICVGPYYDIGQTSGGQAFVRNMTYANNLPSGRTYGTIGAY